MNDLTAKTHEIRRLHAVCRAQRDAVRQACRKQVQDARTYHHEAMRCRRTMRTNGHCAEGKRDYYLFCLNVDLRQQAMHAARAINEILKEMEG